MLHTRLPAKKIISNSFRLASEIRRCSPSWGWAGRESPSSPWQTPQFQSAACCCKVTLVFLAPSVASLCSVQSLEQLKTLTATIAPAHRAAQSAQSAYGFPSRYYRTSHPTSYCSYLTLSPLAKHRYLRCLWRSFLDEVVADTALLVINSRMARYTFSLPSTLFRVLSCPHRVTSYARWAKS